MSDPIKKNKEGLPVTVGHMPPLPDKERQRQNLDKLVRVIRDNNDSLEAIIGNLGKLMAPTSGGNRSRGSDRGVGG